MRRITKGWVAACAVAVVAWLAPDASAQGMEPDAERARQLIQRIRTSMEEIDSLLLRGADPAVVDAEIRANQQRMQQLLDEAESKTKSVIQNIDELIKLGGC